MEREDIKNKIREILIRNKDITEQQEITESYNYYDEGLDSLCIYELVIALEEEYKFNTSESFNDAEITRTKTVKETIDLVLKKLKKQ